MYETIYRSDECTDMKGGPAHFEVRHNPTDNMVMLYIIGHEVVKIYLSGTEYQQLANVLIEIANKQSEVTQNETR